VLEIDFGLQALHTPIIRLPGVDLAPRELDDRPVSGRRAHAECLLDEGVRKPKNPFFFTG
jgi:hypothetical protein